MSEHEIKLMEDVILKGIHLAQKRLMDKAKREDKELVMSKHGKILKVKARDL
ncbi:MAG: hypothetical protein RR555_00705 [Bacteroidales bacterium]